MEALLLPKQLALISMWCWGLNKPSPVCKRTLTAYVALCMPFLIPNISVLYASSKSVWLLWNRYDKQKAAVWSLATSRNPLFVKQVTRLGIKYLVITIMSVYLSVCHAPVLPKRLNVLSKFVHCLISPHSDLLGTECPCPYKIMMRVIYNRVRVNTEKTAKDAPVKPRTPNQTIFLDQKYPYRLN